MVKIDTYDEEELNYMNSKKSNEIRWELLREELEMKESLWLISKERKEKHKEIELLKEKIATIDQDSL